MSETQVRERILEILKDLCPDFDPFSGRKLATDRILRSFDIVTLVTEMMDAFDIEITAVDMVPFNFDSVDAMTGLVLNKLADKG